MWAGSGSEDGLVVRGPHPFLETDPADVYC